MLTLLVGLAAAAPPCEPFTLPDTLEGEHFWVEWDPAVGNPEIGQQTLDWAEEARQAYIDAGYAFTDRVILIRIQDSISDGGLTTTVECGDGTVAPHITLFATAPGNPGQNTTMHEVVHAVQYAYMGSYIESIQSWAWWMEGHATWLTFFADGNPYEQAGPSWGYTDAPWLGLHQGPTAYADPVASRFLYGTVLVALHLEREHGAEAVRATWEYGGPLTGERIFWPDAIEAAGIDFDDFWRGFMAETAVLDVPDAFLHDPVAVEQRVSSFPASGGPSEQTRPGGLGLSITHFRRSAGAGGHDLTVRFEGDPSVEWLAVLVRARGKGPGGKVDEVVPLVIEAGKGTAVLANFDGTREGFLVVSPVALETEGVDYGWTASLDAPAVEEEKAGCGCASGGSGPTGLIAWLFGLVAVGRR